MLDHSDIQSRWFPSQDLSIDVSYLVLSESFIISTYLRFRVWDGIVSPVYVRSNWYSPSLISKSRPFEWCMICGSTLNFYNLYMVKVQIIVLKTLHSVNSLFHDFSNQGNSRKTLNMWRLKNQLIFELPKIITYHEKILEKLYPMTLFSKTSTVTLLWKNPKKPENNPETWYVNEKIFSNDDILYIVEKVLKTSIHWWYFWDRWLKPHHW